MSTTFPVTVPARAVRPWFRVTRTRETLGGLLTETIEVSTHRTLESAHTRMDAEMRRATSWGYESRGDHNRLVVTTPVATYIYHVCEVRP